MAPQLLDYLPISAITCLIQWLALALLCNFPGDQCLYWVGAHWGTIPNPLIMSLLKVLTVYQPYVTGLVCEVNRLITFQIGFNKNGFMWDAPWNGLESKVVVTKFCWRSVCPIMVLQDIPLFTWLTVGSRNFNLTPPVGYRSWPPAVKGERTMVS